MATKKVTSAPYRKKESFLEESENEIKANKAADLYRPGRDAIENVYPEEALVPAARSVAKGTKKVVETVSNKLDMVTRPKVSNTVVRPQETKQTLFSGRIPKSEEDVTHAYRKVSSRELKDITDSGFARRDPNPELSKRTWEDDNKWWSAGDKEGTYGRNWNKGDGTTIRTTKDKVPENRAVRSKDLEILNPETKAFEPLKDVNKHKWKGIM